MSFGRSGSIVSVLVLATGVLAAPAVHAASVIGDAFTVTVTESSVPLSGSLSGTAGSGGGIFADVSVNFASGSFFDVFWTDGDTFVLDWRSEERATPSSPTSPLKNLKVALTGLDFTESGSPTSINSVKQVDVSPGLDFPNKVSFTANSVTVLYPDLTSNEAADGSTITFDVGTGSGVSPGSGKGNGVSVVPVPAALPLFASGLALMGCVGARSSRKRAANT